MHTYYSPREAAEYLGLSPLTLANWRSRRCGPVYVKLGEGRTDRIIYRRRDLGFWRANWERKSKQAAKKGVRLTKDARPDRRKGTTSYATRLAQGEHFEDLPAFRGKRRGGR